jgi:hypothetical protein
VVINKNRTGIVYRATSPSGKQYIGQTIRSLFVRKRNHNRDSRIHDYVFSRAIRKYGIENFIWEILYQNIPEDMLLIAEICAIYYYDTYYNGYNSTMGGDGTIGKHCTDSTKRNIVLSNSVENSYKSKLSWEKVRLIREKYKDIISYSKIAKEFNVSTRCIRSIIKNENWKDTSYIVPIIEPKRFGSMLGKHLSIETRKKLSNINTGKHLTEEVKQKISFSNRGKKQTEQTKTAISLAVSGENNGSAKLTWNKVNEIRYKYNIDITHS